MSSNDLTGSPLDKGAEKVAGRAFGRLHQIDLCQALGVAPSKKYESEGGLGLHHLFGVLRGTFIDRPIVAANAVVQWVAFNYLIGNLDAHAKNIAFLMRGQKAAVAPFYDMLCVEAYLPRQTMSMAIAGENKPGWVEGPHWDAMAYEAGCGTKAGSRRLVSDERRPAGRYFQNHRRRTAVAGGAGFSEGESAARH
jgi:hypothetical protein